MRQVAINWISATLVITSWCNVYSSVIEDPSSRIRIYNALHSTDNKEHTVKSSSSYLHSNQDSASNPTDTLKVELLSLGPYIKNEDIVKQSKTKLSSATQFPSTSYHPLLDSTHQQNLNPTESSNTDGSDNFYLNKITFDSNGIKVPSKTNSGKYNSIHSLNKTGIIERKIEDRQRSSNVKTEPNNLPKVLDPSIRTLAAISRRANKKAISKNHQSNHDRKKRSSFSIQGLDFGDDKYLRNIIGVENPEYEYRRPWRIANTKLLPIVKENEFRKSERDYSRYKGQNNIEISSFVKKQIKENENSNPNLSSSEDKYQSIQKSSYYPISSPVLSADDSLPLKSISSPLSSSSLYSSSALQSEKEPPSYHLNSKKSFYSSHQNSDFNNAKNKYPLHKEHKYTHLNNNEHIVNDDINIYNDIEKSNNDKDVNHSDFKDIQPVAFQSSSKLSVDSRSNTRNNHNIDTNFASYGTKDETYNQNHKLQIKNVGSQENSIMGSLAVEEPLTLASSQRLTSSSLSSSNRSGQREQLPPAAATSNIINAGQSMVRSIMKRRTKTGRYDVPQVGK